MRRFLLAVGMLLWASAAFAQGSVQQLGPVVSGHIPMWNSNGRIMDGGGSPGAGHQPANNTNAGTLPTGMAVVNSGLGYCDYSAYASATYNSLCWGFDGSGNALLDIEGIGGGTPPTFSIIVNGQPWPTGSTLPGAVSTLATIRVPGTNGLCTADDTATLAGAISNAYAATPPGRAAELYLGNGCYLISGTGTEVFLFPHPIHVWGPATFQIASTTGAATDIFRLRPVTIADSTPYTFEGFQVMPQPLGGGGSGVGLAGNNVFALDVSASTGLQMEQPTIRGIKEIVGQNGVTGGEFIKALTAVGQSNGQIFRGIFADNHIYHCIDLAANVSDSQRIVQNFITAPTPGDKNCGFNVQLIDGAGNTVIQRNNISVNGGNIVSGGLNTDISANEFEQQFTSTEANNALLDLQASAQPLDSAWVEHNQFQSVVGVIGHSTIQLTGITAISPGQAVSGTGVPGACTVLAVSTLPQKWVELSCYQTAQIVSGATLTIGGTGFTVAQTAGQASGANIGDAIAIRNTANGASLGPNRFGATMASPMMLNVAGATGCTIQTGNFFASATPVVFSDPGGGCVNLTSVGQAVAYTPTLSCSTGTLTTSSSEGLYSRIGPLTWVTVTATITNHGTCDGSLYATLPAGIVSGGQNSFVGGREVSATNKAISGLLTAGSNTTIGMLYADGTSIAGDGVTAQASGWLLTSQ
jgi:hypothetical protein